MTEESQALTVRSVFKELRRLIKNGAAVNESSQDYTTALKESLDQDYQGYVLITCNKPSESGKMQVELSFGGETNLAAYLVDSAQTYFDERAKEEG